MSRKTIKTTSTHSFIWHRENNFTRKSTFLRLHSWPVVQLITRIRILRRRKMFGHLGSGRGWSINGCPTDDPKNKQSSPSTVFRISSLGDWVTQRGYTNMYMEYRKWNFPGWAMQMEVRPIIQLGTCSGPNIENRIPRLWDPLCVGFFGSDS